MNYSLEEIIDISLLQGLQDKLNLIYSFPSAIIDINGKILTAVAWQDICTKFHRAHPECEKECIKSDQYILAHLESANPAISYQCPHGLVDNAAPIIINGQHLGNFFTGQFFLEEPDVEFFKKQAKKYGFDEGEYLKALKKVPVWSKKKLNLYLDFIKGFIEIIAGIGLNSLKEIEANKELKESLARNQSILKTAMDGFWLVDKKGYLLEVNYSYCRMSGYTEQELLKMHISDLEALENKQNIQDRIQKISKKGQDRFQSKHRCKDGSLFDLEISVQHIPAIEGKFVVFMRDITESKQSEGKLKNSETRLKLATKAGKIGIWDWDIINNNLVWDESMYNLYGLGNEDFSGAYEAWRSSLHPEDALFIENEIQGAINGAKEYAAEFRIIRPDGKIRYIEAASQTYRDKNGKAVRMVGTNIDITEKKRSEILLKEKNTEIEAQNERFKKINEELLLAKKQAEENERRLQSIFFVAPSGIGLVKERVIFEVNPKICEMTGYSKDELIGKSSEILYPSKDEFDFVGQEKYRQINEKGTGIVETTWAKKDGTLIDIMLASTPLDMKDLKKGVTFIAMDITERIQIEKELTIAKEKAEESDKLKTAFLQNMSHEIRTPMNAIYGFSGMLNKPNLSVEKSKSFISIIQNSARQLLSIVSDILTISSIETNLEKISHEAFCLNDIIIELLTIFKPQASEKNIALFAKQHFKSKHSEIYSDKTKIIQILTNLITNALKFTHQGSIEFGYEYITDITQPKYLRFFVKDTGIGVKEELKEKIFERFRQADFSISKKYGGTGLGLAISKAYCQLLGGKIWVQSEPGKETIFFFTIPYNPVFENEKEIFMKEQGNGFHTVLIAEDEEYNFLLIEELLIDLDYLLIHAKNGQEAIDICEANPSVELVLMDIKMPVLSGDIAAKKIKEIRPGLPIIAQSAYGLEHEIKKYSGIFDDYVTKPFDEDQLISKINQYMLK